MRHCDDGASCMNVSGLTRLWPGRRQATTRCARSAPKKTGSGTRPPSRGRFLVHDYNSTTTHFPLNLETPAQRRIRRSRVSACRSTHANGEHKRLTLPKQPDESPLAGQRHSDIRTPSGWTMAANSSPMISTSVQILHNAQGSHTSFCKDMMTPRSEFI